MKRKVYHGWIYIEREPGYKDCFSVQAHNVTMSMGYGAAGAAQAVRYFEETEAIGQESRLKLQGLNLGPIKLEKTPLGLRVFTFEEDIISTNIKIQVQEPHQGE